MSIYFVRERTSYAQAVTQARVARAVVLAEYGCRLNDWCVTRRTQVALAACRVFVYIADSMGIRYDDIAGLCYYSVDSVRDAVEYMEKAMTLRLRAELIRDLVEEHLR